MRKFIIGLLTSAILTLLIVNCSGDKSENIFTVRSIVSHYSYKDRNSETELIVYLNGNSGHTKTVLCAFPPNLKLKGSKETGWFGLKKARIMGKANEYLFGEHSYYAEKVE